MNKRQTLIAAAATLLLLLICLAAGVLWMYWDRQA
jgi:cbb3-type cytochrome oxidase subunit 3